MKKKEYMIIRMNNEIIRNLIKLHHRKLMEMKLKMVMGDMESKKLSRFMEGF